VDVARTVSNALARVKMAQEAHVDGDTVSAGQHLRMAIDDLGEALRGMIEDTGYNVSDMLSGIRAFSVVGAAACEPEKQDRDRLLQMAEERLGGLVSQIGRAVSAVRERSPYRDSAFYLPA
jgi:division protein CdvB (Snf7/Vps24/ESCRT-III family)